MRPSRALVAALLVATSLVGFGGTAVADTTLPASFCGTARNLANDFDDIDPENLTDPEAFETIEKTYKKLAKEAPGSLKAAFKTITKYYNTLGDIGGGTPDPEDAQAFIEQSTKAGKALNKVFKYLSSKCDIDV